MMSKQTFLRAALLSLSLALTPTSALAATSQATTIGAIWGDINGNLVLVTDTDIAVAPDTSATIANSLSQDGFSFHYAASANIASGQLKLLTRASTDSTANGIADAISGSGMPSAFSRIEEDLMLQPSNNDPYTVTISMAVDGNYTQDPTSRVFSHAQLSLFANNGPSDVNYVELMPSANPIFDILTAELTLSGAQSVNVFAQIASDILDISGPDALTEFDFANTAQLSLNVSPGVQITSASGVFLASAVPLPPALPLLLLSALTLLGVRRKHRV